MSDDGERLLATADAQSFMQWQLLLEHQVSTFWPYELDFFLSSDHWTGSLKVLDVGCGTGHYASYLRRYFPDKSYTGIDISPEHIAAAKANSKLKGMEFHRASLFDFRPPELFDAVVMRLVLQHLDDLKSTLDATRSLMKEEGSIIIIEPDPLALKNFPPTPKFDQLLIDYATSAKVASKTRAKLTHLGEQLSNLADWNVDERATYVAPSVGPFSNSSLLQIFSLWIDIFENSKAVDTDFDSVRAELDAWASNVNTFSRMGLQLYCLRAI